MIGLPEEGDARALLRPDRSWTWEEESAVPFAGGDYEIRIKGRLSDSLLAAFEGLTTTVQPVETVLYGPGPEPGGALRPAGPDPVAGPRSWLRSGSYRHQPTPFRSCW
jgi:hypothetical protein